MVVSACLTAGKYDCFLPELTGGFLPELTGGFLPELTGGFLPELTGGFLPELTGGGRWAEGAAMSCTRLRCV